MDTVKAAFRGVTSEGFRVVAIRGVWDFGFRAGGGFTFWGIGVPGISFPGSFGLTSALWVEAPYGSFRE